MTNHPLRHPIEAASRSSVERRASTRVPFPARIVVAWSAASGSRGRAGAAAEDVETCRLVDMGFGGFRLGLCGPMVVGRRGRAVHILPKRTRVDLDFEVVWSAEIDGGWEFGVKFVDLPSSDFP